MTYNFNLMK